MKRRINQAISSTNTERVNFNKARNEFYAASQAEDRRRAREEIEAILMHTEDPAIRLRCCEVLNPDAQAQTPAFEMPRAANDA